jgi:hypothetical protein
MNTLQDAIAAIRTAEASLSKQLQKAIESQDYSAARRLVDAIASIAAARVKLGAQGDTPTDHVASETFAAFAETDQGQIVRDVTPASAWVPNVRNRASRYPVFERDSTRLIKIGWSSKEKRPYEHRVALEVVREVCMGLAKAAHGGPLLKMEKIQPLKSSNGTEIPSYQVYLVLKWLQQVKAVVRKGIDGYVFADPNMSTETVERLLSSTLERGGK